MNPSEQGLTFFKVFDLAFFAPGVVIALTLAWVFQDRLEGFDAQITQAKGILAVVLVIGGIYVVGLVLFSVMWFLFRSGSRQGPDKIESVGDSGWPRFPLLFEKGNREELILYFWYLRATCYGVALALVVSALTLLVACCNGLCLKSAGTGPAEPSAGWLGPVILFELLGAGALVVQGNRFNRGVEGSLAPRALKLQKALKKGESLETEDPSKEEGGVA
ncbi:MAG: hypothetical protein KDD47_24580 [Acidobacteria bacterium]|nr:hypothetical protein [Acidobacteriota bacterium]